jgi:hypothetical protein
MPGIPDRPTSLARLVVPVAVVVGFVAGCGGLPPTERAAVERVVPLGLGWARSSVNASVFRQHGLVSRDGTQYAAFYDPEGRMVLARRTLGTDDWETRTTPYSGEVQDAHNAISLGVDGDGILHVSWDQHGETLRYARVARPGSLELTEPTSMTGRDEEQVTYPQFYHLPDGRLLFVYRDGSSGDGDVVLNRYDPSTGLWSVLHHPLIDGEGIRNAYVNLLAVDASGGVHLSWTWRETWDVATNHDVLYAFSPDGGATWRRSTGEPYPIPITAARAETAVTIPQGRGLINQTTMAVDAEGRPFVATYWRPDGSSVPQYQLVWRDGERWRTARIGQRITPFDLAGGGTRRIPMSRPLVLTAPRAAPAPGVGAEYGAGGAEAVYVVFRDFERGGGISIAVSTDPDREDWRIREVYEPSVGLWEPVHDPGAWNELGRLHLLVQRVGQGDGETLEDIPPQPVMVFEWGR